MKRRTAFVLALVPPLVGLVGFFALLTSPYTGARFEARDGGWVLAGVAPDGPSASWAPLVGSRLLAVGAVEPRGNDLAQDPDTVRTGADLARFWAVQQALGETLVPGVTASWRWDGPDGPRETFLTPVSFPVLRALERVWPYLVTGLFSLFLGWILVHRRPQDRRARVFFFLTGAVALYAAAYGATSSRDLVFPFALQVTFHAIDALTIPAAYLGALAFGLVFPYRRRILDWKPLVPVLVTTAAVVALLFETRLAYDLRLVYFVAFRGTGALLVLSALFTARSNLERRQTLWVVLGLAVSVLPFFWVQTLHLLGLGDPAVPLGVPVFFFLALPLSILVAVGQYGLLDIDSVLEDVMAALPTWVLLAVVDWALVTLAQPFLVPAAPGDRALVLVAVLWATLFAYLPLRNLVHQAMVRLSGRTPLDPQEQLLQFGGRLAAADLSGVLPLAQGWFQALWKLPSVEFLEPGTPDPRWPLARNLSGPKSLYEVTDPGALGPEQASSLLVPLQGSAGLLGCLVLPPRSDRRLYSRTDRTLAAALAQLTARTYENLLTRDKVRQDREQLSRDIHDGIGGSVGNAVLTLNLLLRDTQALPPGPGVRERLEHLRDVLAANLSEIRDLVWGIEEGEETLGDLADHWRQKAQRFLATADVEARFALGMTQPERPLSVPFRVNVVRITQEALTNLLVHSGTKTADLEFTADDQGLKMVVRDYGKGFAPGSRASEGYGLRNMESRARDLGGTLVVRSAPGEGTEVSLSIPWGPGS